MQNMMSDGEGLQFLFRHFVQCLLEYFFCLSVQTA